MKNNINVAKQIIRIVCSVVLSMMVELQVSAAANMQNQAARKRAQQRLQMANRRRQPVRPAAQRPMKRAAQQPVMANNQQLLQAPVQQPVRVVAAKPIMAPTHKAERVTVAYGVSTHQNKRPYQEDRFTYAVLGSRGDFFAVYDGHGGDKTSSYLRNNMHNSFVQCARETIQQRFECAFALSEEYALSHFSDGSTAVIAYIDNNNIVHYAWVGDSRAVLEKDGIVGLATDDHKPDVPAEKKRIENAGGTIKHHGVWRVNGLAISRSIGDKSCKEQGEGQIVAIPAYKQVQLNPSNHFMIIASDGLWDVMNNQDTIDFVKKKLQKNITLNNAAQRLQDEAIKRGSEDNITVCVVKFNWPEINNTPQQETAASGIYARGVAWWNWLWGKK